MRNVVWVMKIESAIILCGGKSKRMGFDKQKIRVNDQLIVLYIASKLEPFIKEIIIVTNMPELYKGYGYKVVEDIVRDCGPMAGLYSGLVNVTTEYCYVVAGDMPYISCEYIQYLDRIITYEKNDIDAVVIKREERIEPFHAVYSKRLCPIMYEHLLCGNYKLYKLIESVNTVFVDEIKALTHEARVTMFTNLNTLEDLECFALQTNAPGNASAVASLK